jgi:hypothetical protein
VIRSRHPVAGQASAEYVAVLLVVALVFGAIATVAVPGVGDRVVRTVRTGICIVGGDVCRTVDARAAGLPPCLTRERSSRQETTVDIALVRLGGNGEWQLALRSDGSAMVTRLAEVAAGGTAGAGVTFSPAGVKLGVSGAVTAGYRGGKAWRFPNAQAAAAFLAAAAHDGAVADRRPPDVTWHALGSDAHAEVTAALGPLMRAGVDGGADAALGLRMEGARKTLALRASAESLRAFLALEGFPPAPAAARSAVIEVSWEGGALHDLALRSSWSAGGRSEEIAGRLDLSSPRHRALAEALLRPRLPAASDLRALSTAIARDGTVERQSYASTRDARSFSAAGRLIVAIGVSHLRVDGTRRLTDAVTWVRGGPAQRRFDCLGLP